MNTGTQKKTKRSGISPLAVLFVALIILFFIGCGAIFFFMEGTNIHQGISGFVRECFMRILLAIVAAVVLICCVKAILSPERTVKSVLLCLLGCILSIIIPFFMLKSMFLDFPYLNHPPVTYLQNLYFDMDSVGDGPTSYLMEGDGIDGKEHSFELNAKVYRQAKELKSDNANLIARVCYLPHTNVVMEVEFLPSMKDCIPEDLPLSLQLPKSWKDFAIQINNNVYQLPLPMSALLADGWTYDDPADSQIILKGVDEWNTYDQENHITLTNGRDQKLSVSVINTAREDIPMEKAVVRGLYVHNSNLDYAGTDVILPGGLMIYWNTYEDVIARYGQPSDPQMAEEGMLCYQTGEDSRLLLTFDDDHFLDSISIENLKL